MHVILLKLAAVLIPIIVIHFIKILLKKAPEVIKSNSKNIDLTQLTKKGAKIVYKRMFNAGVNTKYFAAFEFADGYRTELEVPAEIYSLLVEDDMGVLEYQHGRYIAFHRNQAAYKNGAELEE